LEDVYSNEVTVEDTQDCVHAEITTAGSTQSLKETVPNVMKNTESPTVLKNIRPKKFVSNFKYFKILENLNVFWKYFAEIGVQR